MTDEELLAAAWKTFEAGRDGPTTAPLSRAVLAVCDLVMRRLNRVEVEGLERFHALARRGGRGLLTFSNHVSLLDDPLLLACFQVAKLGETRWVAAEARNFFSSRLVGAFFTRGRCVPVVRGLGLEQPGFDFLIDRLRAGDWVHIFPEGGRTRDPDARLRTPFKPGIGRLMLASQPWAIPFHHVGMDRVLPIGARRPRTGQTVRVRFGDATCFDQAALDALGGETPRERELRLTAWAQGQLEALEATARG